MPHDPVLRTEFVTYAQKRLLDCLAQLERCVRLLSVEQVWHRPNEVSNAVGNLVLHLTGNIRQWIVGGVGGETVVRDRPAEFAQREPLPTEEILSRLRESVEQAHAILGTQTAMSLAERVEIQGYDVSKLAAIFHVVEHFALHMGQIVSTTKLLTNRDLSLYDPLGHRLDLRRSGTP